MKRQLTVREWFLLMLLLAVALVSGYTMLFYLPMTSRRDAARTETEACYAELEAYEIQWQGKKRMEKELEELFSGEKEPVGLAPYDNLQQVMFELNAVLSGTEDYSLSFGTVDTEPSIVRRNISLTFRSTGYEAAKAILAQLHDSSLRCMLETVNMKMESGKEGPVTVDASIVFFEYRE